MSECTHDCSSCGSDCGSRQEPQSFLEKPNAMSNIGKVIGVVSGKGGVGKTLVSSLLAVSMQRLGKNVGIMDADITGPSIPKAFGIHQKADACEFGIIPAKTKMGLDIMSINLLLENESDPVVWRGPVIAGVVKQFWTDVIWKDIDCLVVDMPPGTGDVPLTVFQSLPVDGIVIVTSPQELVSMIVEKAVKMAKLMNIPILGIIENMSYFECPDCGKRHSIYGESHIEDIAAQYDIPVLAKLPIDPQLAKLCDQGTIELFEGEWLTEAAEKIVSMEK
ncbi:Chromosome partitioning ATPase, Mrp family, contains Fe-S cluster [Ruminococcus flavefaciens]|uniref:Iron-sulfur cluster carrier protein n=1 Tax=Ruminococcus flavefaciens TaxID=1265 RepID=A0A1H6KZR3_RUMFL|nr:Mrp/NBP35 family ATP-binding protein [Ruminococcus flavefaciens]SEH81453.1 Chromosome partitioning ATPase, Mrp family, contains Fe-S cluster [Ruminococcus flavefaciens]